MSDAYSYLTDPYFSSVSASNFLIFFFSFTETMLNENDCPQEVMSEKNGQNFILAYKRIDAKIAWPQQALLSYP